MNKRTQLLLSVFMALWLPAQALATVLVHCVTTESESVHHMSQSPVHDDADSDCHGQAAVAPESGETSATHLTGGHTPDLADCFHCTGGCHKLQSMLALDRNSERFSPETGDHATGTTDLAAGYPDFPIRPPKSVLSV